MTTVWVVLTGNQYEGGYVFGVFASKEQAIETATSTHCCFPGGWEPDSNDPLYWENGCDFVKVEEWDVR